MRSPAISAILSADTLCQPRNSSLFGSILCNKASISHWGALTQQTQSVLSHSRLTNPSRHSASAALFRPIKTAHPPPCISETFSIYSPPTITKKQTHYYSQAISTTFPSTRAATCRVRANATEEALSSIIHDCDLPSTFPVLEE